MKAPLFQGTCTALVTPFREDEVNYEMLEILLQRQIDAGIKAVVISGTTGEASTLTDKEKIQLVQHSKEFAGDRLKIIAGTGTNNTKHSVYLTKAAADHGADGILAVSPYYNKASDSGLIAHFTSISDAVSLPIILYNVPSRTGVDISVKVYKELSFIQNIIGIKEASTSIGKIVTIRSQCGDNLYIWAGNDNMAVPTMAVGGIGVISVLSNVFPELTQRMMQYALNGDFHNAAQIQCAASGFCDLLFSEVNPIPVKAVMRLLGYDCGSCRLPLTDLAEEKTGVLKNYLDKIEDERTIISDMFGRCC